MRASRIQIALPAVLALLVLSSATAEAGHRWHRGPILNPEAQLKLGVFDPSEGAGSGVFGGLEVGARASRHLSFGVPLAAPVEVVSRHAEGFIETDQPYDIPVEGTISEFVSSSHLLQLGVVGRLRVPTSPGGPEPFVQGGLLAQLLHLRAADHDGEDSWWHDHDDVVSDTFTGIGWHVGVGVMQPIDRRVGLVGELGYLHAEPTQHEHEGGQRITYRALASGVYARAGLSIRY